jgi:hypothetical protein
MEFAGLRGLADIPAPVGPNPAKDMIEQEPEGLIVMTS